MTLKEMTPEKSIKTINSECENTTMLINASGEFAWALAKAISALEKQIPKKPILDVIFPSGIKWYLCPVCNHNNIEKSDCYCHNCGQALDWSDTE